MKLFFPWQIERMSNKEIRREYSRLRSTANKRLQRLQEKGLGSYGPFRFPTIGERSNSSIQSLLADVSRFLRDKRTTVRGEREFVESELKILHERGYNFIDRSNFYDFTKFMDDQRERYGIYFYDSGDALDVYNQGQRLNIPRDVLERNFDFFVENMEAMEKIKPVRTDKRIRFSDIKRKMKRWM